MGRTKSDPRVHHVLVQRSESPSDGHRLPPPSIPVRPGVRVRGTRGRRQVDDHPQTQCRLEVVRLLRSPVEDRVPRHVADGSLDRKDRQPSRRAVFDQVTSRDPLDTRKPSHLWPRVDRAFLSIASASHPIVCRRPKHTRSSSPLPVSAFGFLASIIALTTAEFCFPKKSSKALQYAAWYILLSFSPIGPARCTTNTPPSGRPVHLRPGMCGILTVIPRVPMSIGIGPIWWFVPLIFVIST